MPRIQGLLLLACLALAADPATGEAGLAELAARRAEVRLVSGAGTQTVVRADEPGEPGSRRAVRFVAAADGRYDVVLTDPADPEGLRERLLCVGGEVHEITVMALGEPEQRKRHRAGQDLLASLMACVRLDLNTLRADYAVELLPADDGLRQLKLVPTRAEILREILAVSLLLDAAGRPVRVAVTESGGNLRRLDLTAFADDPVLEPGWLVAPAP